MLRVQGCSEASEAPAGAVVSEAPAGVVAEEEAAARPSSSSSGVKRRDEDNGSGDARSVKRATTTAEGHSSRRRLSRTRVSRMSQMKSGAGKNGLTRLLKEGRLDELRRLKHFDVYEVDGQRQGVARGGCHPRRTTKRQ